MDTSEEGGRGVCISVVETGPNNTNTTVRTSVLYLSYIAHFNWPCSINGINILRFLFHHDMTSSNDLYLPGCSVITELKNSNMLSEMQIPLGIMGVQLRVTL